MTDAQFKKATVELRLMKGLKQSTIYQPPMVSYLPVSIRTKLAKVWPWSSSENIRDITENEANAISNDVNRPESIRKETKAGIKRYREELVLNKAKEIQIDANNARIKREYLAMQTNILQQQMYPVKTTIIATTCTLVGQWYDEIKKFAPNINIKVHHGSYKSSPDYFNPSVTDIQDVDSKYNKLFLCSPFLTLLHFQFC
jgi:SNF2 family DNA or RNA helicase